MTVSMPSFLATDAQAYEHFMARWSRRLAGPFLDFAGVKGGGRVLDFGCGTGVITAALAERGCTGRRAGLLGALSRRRPPRAISSEHRL
jgi:trans-aconitate methyltransferase